MKSLVLLMMLIPLIGNSQENGIHFEKGLSWEEVIQKANSDNKYIFMDCFATWCKPCKIMDKEVYSLEKVGAIFNEKFISVKLQMDTTQQDNYEVKSLYVDAHNIMQAYKIGAFPTFLFFSPAGKIVHRNLGFMEASDFVILAKNALDPKKQYYTLLENYQKGEKDFTVMPYLATAGQQIKEKDLSIAIAQDYIYNYLFALKGEELYKKENIEFIVSFIQNTEEKSFNLFYKQANKVDSIMKEKGYSKRISDYVITKEKINPMTTAALKAGANPDWNKITRSIKKNYGIDYAKRNVLSAKVRWYDYKEEWPQYIKCMINKVEKYGAFGPVPDVDFNLNNHAWQIFLHSNNKTELNKALLWSDSAVKINNDNNKANWMDTKANLLYKLGRKAEAIVLEEEAGILDSKNKPIQEALAKMRKGEPTW